MLFSNPKKKYFKQRVVAIQKMIWDLEFKREKTLIIKEEVRREYDGATAKLDAVIRRIKSQLAAPEKICEVHNPEEGKPKLHKSTGACVCEFITEGFIGVDELERLYDEQDTLIQNRERYMRQMDGMQSDVQGAQATNEDPEGKIGINEQLESLQELKVMTKQYIQNI